MRTFLNRVANPVVRALLRSPLHGLLSRSVMLITVIGRRTGRSYTLPVQYVRREDTVYVFSPGDRRWWHNLDEGGPVTARIGNETLAGVGEVLWGRQPTMRELFWKVHRWRVRPGDSRMGSSYARPWIQPSGPEQPVANREPWLGTVGTRPQRYPPAEPSADYGDRKLDGEMTVR